MSRAAAVLRPVTAAEGPVQSRPYPEKPKVLQLSDPFAGSR